jgi:hypothetical protein
MRWKVSRLPRWVMAGAPRPPCGTTSGEVTTPSPVARAGPRTATPPPAQPVRAPTPCLMAGAVVDIPPTPPTTGCTWVRATPRCISMSRQSPSRRPPEEQTIRVWLRAERNWKNDKRKRQRAAAEAKAKALLLSLLPEPEQERYRLNGYFEVIGSHGGHYRVRRGIAGNIDWLHPDGGIGSSLCCHPHTPCLRSPSLGRTVRHILMSPPRRHSRLPPRPTRWPRMFRAI